MIKEFQIKDILNAVNSISKMQKKRSKNLKKKDLFNEDGVTIPNNQGKSNRGEILVLNQMIE